MSLASLPPEVLAVIAKYTADAHWHEKELTHRNDEVDLDRKYQVRCDNDGLVPLASVNATMRHICVPTLFSHIGLMRIKNAWKDVFEVLERTMRSRSHVAGCVRSLDLYECDRTDASLSLQDFSTLSRVLEILPSLRVLSCIETAPSADFIDSVNRHTNLHVVNINTVPRDILDSLSRNALRRFTMDRPSFSNLDDHYLILRKALQLGLRLRSLTIDLDEDNMHHAFELDLSSLVELEICRIAQNALAPDFEEQLHALVARSFMLTRIYFLGVIPEYHFITGTTPETSPRAVAYRMPLLGDIASAYYTPTDPENQSSYTFPISDYAISRIDSLDGNTFSSFPRSSWSQWTVTRLEICCHASLDSQNFPMDLKTAMPFVQKLTFLNHFWQSRDFGRRTAQLLHPMKLAPLLEGLRALDNLELTGFCIGGEHPPHSSENFVEGYTSRVRAFADTLKKTISSLETITGSGSHKTSLFMYECKFRQRLISEGGGFEPVLDISYY